MKNTSSGCYIDQLINEEIIKNIMKNNVKEYVLGFAFDLREKQILLIKKNRPEWQAGKYNGIGGKVEPGEIPHAAMIREFEEETGIATALWYNFATLKGKIDQDKVNSKPFIVYVYSTHMIHNQLHSAKSITDEVVEIFELDQVKGLQTTPNLKWLITMALSMEDDSTKSFTITENYV